MSSRSILGLLYTLKSIQAFGINIDPVLKRHGLSMSSMDANAVIDRSRELRVLMDAHKGVKDAKLGLYTGQNFGLAGYGPLSLLLMTSANALQACQVGVEYNEMAYLFGKLSMDINPPYMCLSIEPDPLPQEISRFIIDRDVSGMFKMIQDMALSLGQSLQLKEVWLPLSKPDDISHYEQRFKCPIKFNQPVSRLVIEPNDLSAQFPQANTMAFELYRGQCEAQLKRQRSHNGQLHQNARQYLELFSHHYPSINQLSQYLHISERTLRRHLKEQGYSYQQLLDEVRFNKAKQLLANTQESQEHIAQTLGFSEAPAFNHAFLRWSGISPGKWRKQYSQ
jgi:AraC-like DNA-binding protein